MFFRDKETIGLWKEKCHKLEKENTQLRRKLDTVYQYQKDYEELIESVQKIKKRYERLIEKQEKMYQTYKQALDDIVDEFKENIE